MRDILFRGIWVHGNKEWIEGDLVRDSEGKPHIVDSKYVDYWHGEPIFVCEEECEVIPETVGQHTGLIDKNGKKIFEGDIIRVLGKYIDVVVFYKGCFCMDRQLYNYEFTFQSSEQLEVIGNIHDNPELIEVK